MSDSYPVTSEQERDDLLVTVASLYYEQDQNQQQIAERLEISRSSVSRLIKDARERGIVEIQIRRPIRRNHDLEQALIECFGLRDAYVLATTEGQPEAELLRLVGRLAAGYLQRVIATSLPSGSSIGISWGTGVHAAVSALRDEPNRRLDVVQILGGVGAPNPLIDGPDLARLLAAKLGGRYFDFHAPVLVEQPALRTMLYREPGVAEGLRRARAVRMAITGIGSVADEASSFLRIGHLTHENLAELQRQGIVGETCGRFFDQHGQAGQFPINQRIIGIELEDLVRVPRVVAVARGLAKAPAILGALRGKYLNVLATDDAAAQAVLALLNASDRAPS